MRKWLGAVCVLLGVACLLCSVGFVVYNHRESEKAARAAERLLTDVESVMNEQDAPRQDSQATLPTVKVDGYDCLGVLSIPVLSLELPVLTDWSYPKLKKAPCLYYGSYSEKDFVIAAHNYKAHFGRLSELQAGDMVMFTAVNGTVYRYKVVLLETLPQNATAEMITSGFDLSLYTCTSGGGSRVTVRCNLA